MECGSFDPCPWLWQRRLNVKRRPFYTYVISKSCNPPGLQETCWKYRTICAGFLDGSQKRHVRPLSAGVRRCPPGIRLGWLVRAGLVRGLLLSRCPLDNSFHGIDFGLVRVSGHKNALSAPKGLKSKISDLFLLGAWVTRSMFFCLAIWVPASRVCVDLCSCGIVLTP